MTTYAERAAQIREAHTLDPHGWCRCGLAPTLTPADHAAHIASMTTEAARRHAEKLAREQIQAWGGEPTYPVLEIATAAALQALTETENAR